MRSRQTEKKRAESGEGPNTDRPGSKTLTKAERRNTDNNVPFENLTDTSSSLRLSPHLKNKKQPKKKISTKKIKRKLKKRGKLSKKRSDLYQGTQNKESQSGRTLPSALSGKHSNSVILPTKPLQTGKFDYQHITPNEYASPHTKKLSEKSKSKMESGIQGGPTETRGHLDIAREDEESTSITKTQPQRGPHSKEDRVTADSWVTPQADSEVVQERRQERRDADPTQNLAPREAVLESFMAKFKSLSSLKRLVKKVSGSTGIPREEVKDIARKLKLPRLFQMKPQIMLLAKVLDPSDQGEVLRALLSSLVGIKMSGTQPNTLLEDRVHSLAESRPLLLKYVYFFYEHFLKHIFHLPIEWAQDQKLFFEAYLKGPNSREAEIPYVSRQGSYPLTQEYNKLFLPKYNSGGDGDASKDREYLLKDMSFLFDHPRKDQLRSEHLQATLNQSNSRILLQVIRADWGSELLTQFVHSQSIFRKQIDSLLSVEHRQRHVVEHQTDGGEKPVCVAERHLSFLIRRMQENALSHKASLSRFLVTHIPEVYGLVHAFRDLLMGFDFQFTLENTNVTLVQSGLDSGESRDIEHRANAMCERDFDLDAALAMVNEIAGKIKTKSGLLKSLEYISTQLTDQNQTSKPKRFAKIKKYLRQIVHIVVFVCITNIKKRQPLTKIKDWLNKREELRVVHGFWSEHLLLQLVLQYSDFELKHLIIRKLAQERPLPWFQNFSGGGERDHQCVTSTDVDMCETTSTPTNQLNNLSSSDRDTETPDIHTVRLFAIPHLRLIARQELCVLSLSLGLARHFQVGKTQYLNSLFHLDFETLANDPCYNTRTQVHFGRNFYPSRHIAVIDSNLQCRLALAHMKTVANIVIVQVLFTDVVDNYESVKLELSDMIDMCLENDIRVVVCVRDYNDYLPYRAQDLDPKNLLFSLRAEREEYSDLETTESDSDFYSSESSHSQPKSEFRSAKRLGLEVDRILEFYAQLEALKPRKSKSTSALDDLPLPLQYTQSRVKRVKQGRANCQALRAEIQSKKEHSTVQLYTIVNLDKANQNGRDSLVEKGRNMVNKVVHSIVESQSNSSTQRFKLNASNLLSLEKLRLGGKFIFNGDTTGNKTKGVNPDFGETLSNTGKSQSHQSALVTLNTDTPSQNIITSIIKGTDNIIRQLTQIDLRCPTAYNELFPVDQVMQLCDSLKKRMARLDLADSEQHSVYQAKLHIHRGVLKELLINPLLQEFVTQLKEHNKTNSVCSFLVYLDRELNQFVQRQEKQENNHIQRKVKLNSNLFWRNLLPFLKHSDHQFFNHPDDRTLVLRILERVWLKGQVFELVDGDNYQFQGDILSLFHSIDSDRAIQIVGVMGPQSSGKSTLMNLMTGSDFHTADGICTRGINCYLQTRKSSRDYFLTDSKSKSKRKGDSVMDKETQYILYLDCQGMLSSEEQDSEFDQKSGTFLLSACDTLYLNFSGEISHPLSQIMQSILFTSRNIKRDFTNKHNLHIDNQILMIVSNKNMNLQQSDLLASSIINNSLKIRENVQGAEIHHEEPSNLETNPAFVFKPSRDYIKLLGNAFNKRHISNGQGIGNPNQGYSIKNLNPDFIETINQLKKQTQSNNTCLNRTQSNFKKFKFLKDSLPKLWDSVYYHAEIVSYSSITQRMVVNEMQAQINHQFTNLEKLIYHVDHPSQNPNIPSDSVRADQNTHKQPNTTPLETKSKNSKQTPQISRYIDISKLIDHLLQQKIDTPFKFQQLTQNHTFPTHQQHIIFDQSSRLFDEDNHSINVNQTPSNFHYIREAVVVSRILAQNFSSLQMFEQITQFLSGNLNPDSLLQTDIQSANLFFEQTWKQFTSNLENWRSQREIDNNVAVVRQGLKYDQHILRKLCRSNENKFKVNQALFNLQFISALKHSFLTQIKDQFENLTKHKIHSHLRKELTSLQNNQTTPILNNPNALQLEQIKNDLKNKLKFEELFPHFKSKFENFFGFHEGYKKLLSKSLGMAFNGLEMHIGKSHREEEFENDNLIIIRVAEIFNQNKTLFQSHHQTLFVFDKYFLLRLFTQNSDSLIKLQSDMITLQIEEWKQFNIAEDICKTKWIQGKIKEFLKTQFKIIAHHNEESSIAEPQIKISIQLMTFCFRIGILRRTEFNRQMVKLNSLPNSEFNPSSIFQIFKETQFDSEANPDSRFQDDFISDHWHMIKFFYKVTSKVIQDPAFFWENKSYSLGFPQLLKNYRINIHFHQHTLNQLQHVISKTKMPIARPNKSSIKTKFPTPHIEYRQYFTESLLKKPDQFLQVHMTLLNCFLDPQKLILCFKKFQDHFLTFINKELSLAQSEKHRNQHLNIFSSESFFRKFKLQITQYLDTINTSIMKDFGAVFTLDVIESLHFVAFHTLKLKIKSIIDHLQLHSFKNTLLPEYQEILDSQIELIVLNNKKEFQQKELSRKFDKCKNKILEFIQTSHTDLCRLFFLDPPSTEHPLDLKQNFKSDFSQTLSKIKTISELDNLLFHKKESKLNNHTKDNSHSSKKCDSDFFNLSLENEKSEQKKSSSLQLGEQKCVISKNENNDLVIKLEDYLTSPDKTLHTFFQYNMYKQIRQIYTEDFAVKFKTMINGLFCKVKTFITSLKLFLFPENELPLLGLNYLTIQDQAKNTIFHGPSPYPEENLQDRLSRIKKSFFDQIGDFNFRLLKCIFENQPFETKFSHTYQEYTLEIDISTLSNFFNNNHLQRNHLLCDLFNHPFQVHDLQDFLCKLENILQQIESEFSHDFDSQFSLSESILEKMKETFVGCTHMCPLCNRLCELPKHGDEVQHSCKETGHNYISLNPLFTASLIPEKVFLHAFKTLHENHLFRCTAPEPHEKLIRISGKDFNLESLKNSRNKNQLWNLQPIKVDSSMQKFIDFRKSQLPALCNAFRLYYIPNKRTSLSFKYHFIKHSIQYDISGLNRTYLKNYIQFLQQNICKNHSDNSNINMYIFDLQEHKKVNQGFHDIVSYKETLKFFSQDNEINFDHFLAKFFMAPNQGPKQKIDSISQREYIQNWDHYGISKSKRVILLFIREPKFLPFFTEQYLKRIKTNNINFYFVIFTHKSQISKISKMMNFKNKNKKQFLYFDPTQDGHQILNYLFEFDKTFWDYF